MSLDANKAIVTRYWMEVWTEKRLEVIDEITSSATRFHFPPGQAHKPADLHHWIETSRAAFPDVRFTIHELLAEGEMVACRWSYIAVHSGDFLGIKATNRSVTDQGINLFRIQDGKIAEMWMSGDSLGLLKQLGVIAT